MFRYLLWANHLWWLDHRFQQANTEWDYNRARVVTHFMGSENGAQIRREQFIESSERQKIA